jgi:hypothetical protein
VVAEAVYHAAVADGVATRTHDDIKKAIRDIRWLPEYGQLTLPRASWPAHQEEADGDFRSQ